MQHAYLIVVIGRKIVAGEMIFFQFFYLRPNTYTHMHKIQYIIAILRAVYSDIYNSLPKLHTAAPYIIMVQA